MSLDTDCYLQIFRDDLISIQSLKLKVGAIYELPLPLILSTDRQYQDLLIGLPLFDRLINSHHQCKSDRSHNYL